MTPLQFQAGDLHLAGVNDNRVLKRKAGEYLNEVYGVFMNLSGDDLVMCWETADLDRLENIHMVVHDDPSMSDGSFVGSLVLYNCLIESEVDGVVTVSAMPAPARDGYPGDAWIGDTLAILARLLGEVIPCKDGRSLAISEVMFPTEGDGSPPQNLWFTPPGVSLDSRSLFMSMAAAMGLSLTVDGELRPISMRVS
jgi:hypothetical protein